MPRVKQELTNANFGRGIITETGPLGYPENSVKDMNNLELLRNGSVRVRNGLTFPTTKNARPVGVDAAYSIHYWDNPANNNESFLVIQVGSSIYCMSTSGEYIGHSTLTAGSLIDGTVRTDLRDILRGSVPKQLRSVQSRSRLYMTSAETGPFYLEYLPDGRANSEDYNKPGADSHPCVQIVTIRPKYRDLYGLNDGLSVDTRPVDYIPEHIYNLKNASWTDYWINEFRNGHGGKSYPDFGGINYPAQADYFWFGYGLNPNNPSDPSDEFLGYRYFEYPLGSAPSPMGHYILDVYNPNREEQSGIDNLPNRGKAYGPAAVGFFAGRVWYAGFTGGGFEDNVLFSNVIPFEYGVRFEKKYNNFVNDYAGRCYQKNDPSARDVNDLVDDDGGVIPIPGIGKVKGIVSLKTSLIVISDKGAWSISGGLDPFSANNYSVNKITSVGCVSSDSVIELEQAVVYWGYGDIVYIGEDQSGSSVARSITDQSIKTLYINISVDEKIQATGHYDKVNKKAYWSYGQNKCLIFDTVLNAYSQYTFSGNIEESKFVTVINNKPESSQELITVNNEPVTEASDNVVLSETKLTNFDNQLVVCVKKNGYILVGRFDSTDSGNYYDLLPKEISTDYPVKAHLEVGANGFGDLMRKKQAFRVFCYFQSNESLVVPTDYKVKSNRIVPSDDTGFEPIDQSGCYAQGRWEWAERSVSGQFSQKQQAYVQPKLDIIIDPHFDSSESYSSSDVEKYGCSSNLLYSISLTGVVPAYEVVSKKLRVRGRGKVLNMYFENETGKGFHLLGWAAPAEINRRP